MSAVQSVNSPQNEVFLFMKRISGAPLPRCAECAVDLPLALHAPRYVALV